MAEADLKKESTRFSSPARKPEVSSNGTGAAGGKILLKEENMRKLYPMLGVILAALAAFVMRGGAPVAAEVFTIGRVATGGPWEAVGELP